MTVAVEHIIALMTLGGIESLSYVKYVCGAGTRLHVSMAPFEGAPDAVTAQGVVMKDAIAQIMSVANIARISVKPSPEDMERIERMWERSVEAANAANGGSAQDFGDSGGGL